MDHLLAGGQRTLAKQAFSRNTTHVSLSLYEPEGMSEPGAAHQHNLGDLLVGIMPIGSTCPTGTLEVSFYPHMDDPSEAVRIQRMAGRPAGLIHLDGPTASAVSSEVMRRCVAPTVVDAGRAGSDLADQARAQRRKTDGSRVDATFGLSSIRSQRSIPLAGAFFALAVRILIQPRWAESPPISKA